MKNVRTDNGGEYMGRKFQDLCIKLGIIHQTMSPYTPEYNGIAEHYNRTLQEGGLTLRHDSGLGNRFWVSSIHTVNFVHNMMLHSRIHMTSHEAFWGKKPSVDWLRTYGSRCWVLVPKATRKKGDYRSVEGVFVGYFDDSKAYKIWIPSTRTVVKARDAIFDEFNHIEKVTIHATDEDDLPSLWIEEAPVTITPSITTSHDTCWEQDHQLPFHVPPTESGEHTPEGGDTHSASEESMMEPQRQEVAEEEGKPAEEEGKAAKEEGEAAKEEGEATEEGEIGEEIDVAPKDFERGLWMDPTTTEYGRGKRHRAAYTEVIALAHGISELETTEWREACQQEYDNLMGYHTWMLVDRPPNTNIMGSCWIFRVKRDNLGHINKYKAKLVAQGFSQVPGIDFDETYSPTIRFTTIRLIIAFACKYSLKLRQLDIKGAYLNGILEQAIYMKRLEGFVKAGDEDKVCKLHKSLYGLKQLGRV